MLGWKGRSEEARQGSWADLSLPELDPDLSKGLSWPSKWVGFRLWTAASYESQEFWFVPRPCSDSARGVSCFWLCQGAGFSLQWAVPAGSLAAELGRAFWSAGFLCQGQPSGRFPEARSLSSSPFPLPPCPSLFM